MTGPHPFPSPPRPPPPPSECVCSGSSGPDGFCSVFHKLQGKKNNTQLEKKGWSRDMNV